jgi:5-formaminoimidazole-4-carboxamide-1-(beta)-D-ribofuranosyl 5'-monophosphate synthetase
MGFEQVEKFTVPYFGNKRILRWESDRNAERTWLKAAGLSLPKIYRSPKDIDGPVIVKFHGAGGGKGYFLARDEADFNKKIAPYKHLKNWVIQEYVIGVPIYVHYFHSPLTGEIEIMGMDKRYESNVDGIGRISARDQIVLPNIDPSYVIVGNIPIVIRESFLPKLIEMGENVVAQSKKIAPPGLFGPFCLETILTPEEEIKVFEISARIVAGTNPYVDGSPYTALKYKEPMSTGRRIAREIKIAIQQNRLKEVLA